MMTWLLLDTHPLRNGRPLVHPCRTALHEALLQASHINMDGARRAVCSLRARPRQVLLHDL